MAFMQPKHSHTGPIVPENKRVEIIGITAEEVGQASELRKLRKVDNSVAFGAYTVQKGSRVLEVVLPNEQPVHVKRGRLGAPQSDGPKQRRMVGYIRVGILWSPVEFVEETKRIHVHPFDLQDFLTDELKQVVFRTLSSPPSVTIARGNQEVERWEAIIEQTKEEEAAIHGKLCEGAQKMLQNAKLLFLKRLLSEIGWEDTGLVGDLLSGMPIVGEIPNSNVFSPHDSKATTSVKVLARAARDRKKELLSSMGPSSPDLDKATKESTMKEIKAGTMLGPYEVSEVDHTMGFGYQRGASASSRARSSAPSLRSRPPSTVQSTVTASAGTTQRRTSGKR